MEEMSVYLDEKYLMLISSRLEGFKKVHNDLYNFRCVVCGDSKRDKLKARGYLILSNKGEGLFYKCHNCGYVSSFGDLLKQIDPHLFKQYLIEKLRENKFDYDRSTLQDKKLDKAIFKPSRVIVPQYADAVLDRVDRLDKLPDDHPCKAYCINRSIPYSMFPYLYYASDFKSYVNSFKPGKFTHNKVPEQRLIIPYFDKHGRCFAMQGRALDPNNPIRYFTIKVDEENGNRVYGLDRVDFSKDVLIVEGPIDSMFLPNCLAVSGSDYGDPIFEQLKPISTIVPDNEPRNKQVCQSVEKMIKRGFKVCLWPNDCNFKDINEAVLNGYTQSQLVDIIKNNTVQGLPGEIRFKLWKKY